MAPAAPADVPQIADFMARWDALRAKQVEADAKQQNFTEALVVLKNCVADIVQLASTAGKGLAPAGAPEPILPDG